MKRRFQAPWRRVAPDFGGRLRQMAFAGLLASLAGTPVVAAESIQGPDPERILELARSSYVLRDHELEGRLRQGFKVNTFRFTMQDGMIRFKFDDPKQIIHLEIRDDGCLLREVVAGSDAPVEAARYREAVRDTDISYEDLAMRFLYWPDPRYLGEEKVSSANCWRLLVTNPGETGPYAQVLLWIDQSSGGLAQMMGLDAEGRVLRKFLVRSVQKIGSVWMLKEMRIERFDVASGKVEGRTYLSLAELGPQKNPFFKRK